MKLCDLGASPASPSSPSPAGLDGNALKAPYLRAISAWPIIGRLAIVAADALKGVRFRWAQRGFTAHEIQRSVLGESLTLWIADTDARDWYERSSYLTDDWPEMRFMRDRLVHRGDVVIDCGAHQGITAVLLARWVGASGQVIAIDPVPHNVDVATRNLERNAIQNVTYICAAAGRTRGWAHIGGGTNVQVGVTPVGQRTPVVPLDELISARPTLLKLDVEGFEDEVIAGALKLLDLKPRIAMELHVEALRKFGRSPDAALVPLLERGYELWVEWDDGDEPQLLKATDKITHRVHIFGFPPTSDGSIRATG